MRQHRIHYRASGPLLVFTACLLSSALWGCQRGASQTQPAAGAAQTGTDNESPVAVEFAGRTLTLEEIERPVAHQIFELRTMAAQDRVLAELIQAEATKRGLTPEKLIDDEVEARVPSKSDAALQELYEQLQRERENSSASPDQVGGPLPPFEEFKLAARHRASPAERRVIEQKLFERLMQTANVRMHLSVLGRPKPLLAADGPSLGPEQAQITIVEYTDFTSPFCAQAQPTLERLLAEFPKQLRVVFRQDPNAQNPAAAKVAEAALCADDQGRYWDYRKRLFANQQSLERESLIRHARELSLDITRFTACLETGEKAGKVKRDSEEARRNDLGGSPVFLVNGTRLSGAHDVATFERLIRQDLPAG